MGRDGRWGYRTILGNSGGTGDAEPAAGREEDGMGEMAKRLGTRAAAFVIGAGGHPDETTA
jgi:hypothetical protein